MIIQVRVDVPDDWPSDEWLAALAALTDSGHRIISVRQEELARPPSSPRSIDHCPTCGSVVDTIEGSGMSPSSWRHHARPCGHRVDVTMWPDRVELHRARA